MNTKPIIPTGLNPPISRLYSFALALLLIMIVQHKLIAGSATWNLNPTSNDWNTAANWTPESVPDQLGDTATFDVSNVTSIVVSNYVNIAAIIFNPAASSYHISGNLL